MRFATHLAATGIALGALLSSTAQADTITFDDIAPGPGQSIVIPDGHHGLTWSNFWILNTDGYEYNPSGYEAGAVSGTAVAYNSFENPASFSSTSPFTFHSIYLTAAWNDGLSVTLTGSLNGIDTISATVFPLSTGPTLYTFDWSNIDRVTIKGAGGIDHPEYPGGGQHVAMDNLTVTAVPEPEVWALALAGLGVAGVVGRARRQHMASPRLN